MLSPEQRDIVLALNDCDMWMNARSVLVVIRISLYNDEVTVNSYTSGGALISGWFTNKGFTK